MHSLVASPYKSAYNAAKHGVAGFTKASERMRHPSNESVCAPVAVCMPAYVNTHTHTHIHPPTHTHIHARTRALHTQTLALEMAQRNITVNAVCPGYTLTDLVRNQIDDTAR